MKEDSTTAFYMESSLHCENRTKTFEQTYKLLKPGGRLVAMEYVLLDGWDENNEMLTELMRLHLHGTDVPRPTIEEDLAMIRAAGFEIDEHFDYMGRGKELYVVFDSNHFTFMFHENSDTNAQTQVRR